MKGRGLSTSEDGRPRPGASRVSAADEIARVAPVLEAICERFKDDPRNIAVSVDTFYGEVVKVADAIGVDIINDVSGGVLGRRMLSAVANTKVPLDMFYRINEETLKSW